MDFFVKCFRVVRVALFTAFVAFVFVIGFHAYVSNVIVVQQDSMNPTLFEGDLLLTDKMAYWFGKPEVGDIVIVLRDEPTGLSSFELGKTVVDYFSTIFGGSSRVRYVKRVVAIEGDLVEFWGGDLIINGVVVDEDYVQGSSFAPSRNFSVVVPEDEFFLLGDNREVSLDSRHFGTVSLDMIESRVVE